MVQLGVGAIEDSLIRREREAVGAGEVGGQQRTVDHDAHEAVVRRAHARQEREVGIAQHNRRIAAAERPLIVTSTLPTEAVHQLERLAERCATMHRVFTDRLYDAWLARVRTHVLGDAIA